MWDLSSPTRDRTHVPCIDRWILNHWTTREVSPGILNMDTFMVTPDPQIMDAQLSHGLVTMIVRPLGVFKESSSSVYTV